MSEANTPEPVIPGSEGITTSSTPQTAPEAPAAAAATPAPADGAAPAAAAPEGQEAAAPPTPAPDADAEGENRGKERLNARFSELTSARKAAEEAAAAERTRAETAEAELQRLRGTQAQPPPQRQDGAPQPPNPNDFPLGEYDPGYIDAKVDFSVRAALAQQQRTFEEGQMQARENQARAEYQQTVTTTRAKLLDSGLSGAALLASGDPNIPCTPHTIQVLSTMENAPQVANYLGTNVAEATRIASLPPHLQGVELARIEARLAKPVEVTKAPTPTPTVNGLAPASDDFNPSASQAEFEEQVNRKHGGFKRPGFG